MGQHSYTVNIPLPIKEAEYSLQIFELIELGEYAKAQEFIELLCDKPMRGTRGVPRIVERFRRSIALYSSDRKIDYSGKGAS